MVTVNYDFEWISDLKRKNDTGSFFNIGECSTV